MGTAPPTPDRRHDAQGARAARCLGWSPPMTETIPPLFGASLDFASDRVVVRLLGHIEVRTASDFESVLGVALDRRDREVIVDAGDVEFLDAAAVGALARVASELDTAGRRLVVRAPGPWFRRLIDSTGLNDRPRTNRRRGAA